MKFHKYCDGLFLGALGYSLDFGSLPPERDSLHPPLKDKKHNRFNPALKHKNKHRYVSSRKLSRR